jgi:aromatic ring-opening dioxygenase catalytic subunit (LigB family)
MNTESNSGFTRRQALAAGIAATAVAATGASLVGGGGPQQAGAEAGGSGPGESAADNAAGNKASSNKASSNNASSTKGKQRMPVVFLPHGGGPWPFADTGIGEPQELSELSAYLRGINLVPPTPPKALLVVSAHWEEPNPTVMSGPQPPMLYDYHGFPPESYQVTWPAPGSPQLAQRVQTLLQQAGINAAANAERGFDHGTFVPLKLTYPEADVPTVQLSLKRGLDPAEHIAIGRALEPLRDEGVFIIGSGMTYHNLRAFNPRARPVAEAFDAWLRETAVLGAAERDRRLSAWTDAPQARAAHPREEHLLPLMVIAGAAGADVGKLAYNGTILGLRLSAYHFG